MRAGRVVIGVGNPMRGDDGVGWAVARAVAADAPPSVRVELLDGEPTRLLDACEGAEVVVVVDAIHRGGRPGAVDVVDVSALSTGAASTHGLGVADAVVLADRLGRSLPPLLVVGVESVDFELGHGLSPDVLAAVGPAAEVVRGCLDDAEGGTIGPSRPRSSPRG